MSLITKAPPAASIVINSTDLHLFMAEGINNPGVCFLPIPGSTGLQMTLLDVTATGTVKANQPGDFEAGLFVHVAEPNVAPPDGAIGGWVQIGVSPAEPIGGAADLVATSWMIQGKDLMFNLQSGKMQGTFKSNVADNPVAAADLSTNPNNIDGDLSPLMYFAVGVRFTPTADDGSTPEIEMANFILSGEI